MHAITVNSLNRWGDSRKPFGVRFIQSVLTTRSSLANYLTKGLKEMTNTWPGKPVCGPRNETSNLRNRKQFQTLYPDLELRFQSARNVIRIYIFCWHIWGTGEMLRGFRWGDMRERDHLEDLSIDGRIILILISNKVVREGTDWIDLAQDRDRWRTLVNGVMNLRVPQNARNFLISWGPVSFEELGSRNFVIF